MIERLKVGSALLALAAFAPAANTASAVRVAAEHFQPEAAWREASVVSGDFTCSGRKQWAILGTTSSKILIAIFGNGTTTQPQILRYSSRVRRAETAVLSVETLDYEPKDEVGYELPGFVRSKSCKGLNLSDGEIDSAHIYWDRVSKHFSDWTR